jgi:polysaccharide pyruvyl transferase WcaK-like protein
MLEPTLKAYDNVLREATSIEFVGNRLHGGIRALQQQRRTLVLSIDERAREIGEDTGLPVVDRSDITCIEQFIRSKSTTTILLPWSDIERWRNQFKSITD